LKRTATTRNPTMSYIQNFMGNTSFRKLKGHHIVQGLLSLVILLYFPSCNEGDEVGLVLENEETLASTTFTDTVSISSHITLIDTVFTTLPFSTTGGNWLIGRITDDTFGITTANAYARIVLPFLDEGDTLGFPEDHTFDSAKIVMPYLVDTGDPTATQTFEVYELSQELGDEDYYHTSALPFEPTPIGQKTLTPAEDTTRLLQIRVDGLGERIFNASRNRQLVDSIFNEVLKGLVIRPAAGDEGYVISVRPITQNLITFNLRLYSSALGDTIPSVRNLFFSKRFHQIEKDFTGTPLEGLQVGEEIPTEDVGNRLLIQYLGGVTSKISFPNLENFADGRDVLINRAELVFEPAPGSIDKYGLPPASLAFFEPDENGLLDPRSFLGDDATELGTARQPTPLLARFRQNGLTYSPARLTHYVQQVVSGERPNSGIILGLLTATFTTRKLMLMGAQVEDPQLRIKLRVHYTTF